VEQGERVMPGVTLRPIMPVILVQAAGHTLALPQRYVLEVIDLASDDTARVATINETQVLIIGKRVVPLVKLRRLLKLSEFPSIREERVAVVRVGAAEFGLVVEEASELLEAMLQKLPRSILAAGCYRGAILDAQEKPLLVLDVAGLARAIGFRHVEDIPPEAHLPLSPESRKGFLVFRAGSGAPKAVLLEQVISVEEITLPSATRVLALPGTRRAVQGQQEVLMLRAAQGTAALAIEKVVDIMYAPLELRVSEPGSIYRGMLNIGGRATELVDVDKLGSAALSEAA
jgi:two-component system chemotaxis sensor kinase CheA